MPGLTLQTGPTPVAAGVHRAAPMNPHTTNTSSASRTSSPTRPPVSPITPKLEPALLPGSSSNNAASRIPNFALGRPAFTHQQPDQVGIVPPPAEPIAFDDNPDVLALKSAISILQLQRARATADMQALNRAKAAALANPGAFVADLATGRVGVEGDPLMFPGASRNGGDDEDSSSSEDEESDEEDIKEEDSPDTTPRKKGSKSGASIPHARGSKTKDADGDVAMATTDGIDTGNGGSKRKGKQKSDMTQTEIETETKSPATAPPPGSEAWRKLPKPQTVVRCPPINWAQYGVVGESLDKLHAEQVAAPTPGVPATLGPGAYEFKAGDHGAGEPSARLVGIAAPYTPGKDRIEKKSRSGKR